MDKCPTLIPDKSAVIKYRLGLEIKLSIFFLITLLYLNTMCRTGEVDRRAEERQEWGAVSNQARKGPGSVAAQMSALAAADLE